LQRREERRGIIMAKKFIPLTDTKDMRRALGLLIFKPLKHMKRVEG
jgi:hypothetical protein